MELFSPEFTDGAVLDISYQADHDNQSPALVWENVPENVKSFAVAMHDPDAPTGGAGWWHWFVYNLPANIRSLSRNAGDVSGANLPEGAKQLFNDGGARAYGGCLPPVGDPAHRYIFTVYALDTIFSDDEIPENAQTSMAGFMVNAHTIDKASLTGFLAR